MNVLKVKKGETLARKQDKVMEWYLIQEGSVIRQFAFAEIIMHRNAIVGILENEWFACDYVANVFHAVRVPNVCWRSWRGS